MPLCIPSTYAHNSENVFYSLSIAKKKQVSLTNHISWP
jgi:hypothetical protein